MSNNFIACKCPQCGADLDLDKKLETAFCTYCGTKIIIKDVVNKVKITNLPDKENYEILADRAFGHANYQESYDLYQKVLAYDPNNYIYVFRKGYSYTALKYNTEYSIKELIDGYKDAVDMISKEYKHSDECLTKTSEIIRKTNSLVVSMFSELRKQPDAFNINMLKAKNNCLVNIYEFNINLFYNQSKLFDEYDIPLEEQKEILSMYQTQLQYEYKELCKIPNLGASTILLSNKLADVKASIKRKFTNNSSNSNSNSSGPVTISVIMFIFSFIFLCGGFAGVIPLLILGIALLITGICILTKHNASKKSNGNENTNKDDIQNETSKNDVVLSNGEIEKINKNQKGFYNKYIKYRLLGFRKNKTANKIFSIFWLIEVFAGLCMIFGSKNASDVLINMATLNVFLIPYVVLSRYPWRNKCKVTIDHPAGTVTVLEIASILILGIASTIVSSVSVSEETTNYLNEINSQEFTKPIYEIINNDVNIDLDYLDLYGLKRDIEAGNDVIGKTLISTINSVSKPNDNRYLLKLNSYIYLTSETNPGLTIGQRIIVKITDVYVSENTYYLSYEILYIKE